MPIASLVPDQEETTGSIAVKSVSPLSRQLGTEDWRRAKAALATALDPQGSGASVAWNNPDTTMKGSFVPVGSPFVKNDEVCRTFVAKVDGQGTAKSLQGTACRAGSEDWAIREVKPWRKPD